MKNYQLIRNVLRLANTIPQLFYPICDERRPDLVESHQTVKMALKE
jgi:hypothetical protein